MGRSALQSAESAAVGRRAFPRIDVRCRARIRIGNRQYAGFIENISEGGARFTTVSPIRATGPVTLIIPDLPPMRGRVRWMESNGAGVSFTLRMDDGTLDAWARARLQRC